MYELYRREKDADLSQRWQALWLLRRGERLIRVKVVVGVIHRTIQRWVRWYEVEGIEEVLRWLEAGGRLSTLVGCAYIREAFQTLYQSELYATLTPNPQPFPLVRGKGLGRGFGNATQRPTIPL